MAPAICWAEETSITPSPKGDFQTSTPAGTPGPPDVLQDIFKSRLEPKQLEALGQRPSSEDLAGAMSPEQKTGARSGLKELEGKTKDPEVLAQIARGYDLLKSPTDMGRVGVELQQLNPKSPKGFAVSAYAAAQLHQNDAAAVAAKEALRRDPNDPVGLSVLMLARNASAAEVNLDPARNAFQTSLEHSPRAGIGAQNGSNSSGAMSMIPPPWLRPKTCTSKHCRRRVSRSPLRPKAGRPRRNSRRLAPLSDT